MKSLKLKLFRFFLLFAFLTAMPVWANDSIKAPNVSGQFYDSNSLKLNLQLEYFKHKAPIKPSSNHIDILISPHAGYYYSGQTAAYGYKLVSKQKVNTVVVLGFAHHKAFDEISVWPKGAFQTPLGKVPVNQPLSEQLINAHSAIVNKPDAFDKEHSLEVQLPFIQKTFPKADIVPIIFGQPSFEVLTDFANILNQTIADRKDVLVVVSTDLSHFHDDEFARKMDRYTLDAIEAIDPRRIWQGVYEKKMELCGVTPTVVGLLYAKAKGLNKAELVRYSNSSEITGDKTRVVGYPSVVIYRSDEEDADHIQGISLEHKRKLVEIARSTVDEYVKTGKVLSFNEPDARLNSREGAFVTLTRSGQLRGCIGHIIGRGPLYKTVRDLAVSASSKDHRFKPVTPDELKDIHVEVSVLSEPRRVKSAQEIVMGTHGVIISRGFRHRGVFLPQVATDTGWSKEEFLNELCSQKAGLPIDCWKDPKTVIEVFTANVFSEKEVHEK